MPDPNNFAHIVILFVFAVLVVFVWSVFWAKEDAERRGKSGWLAALMVFLLPWPSGIIVWLLIRPEGQSLPPVPNPR